MNAARHHVAMTRRSILLAVISALAAPAVRADDAALWRALAAGGHVAIMRHATAPGTGDPPTFKLGDCATQRNLNEAGRAEARAIGARFRSNGVAVGRVAASQWCRARDTATELGLGPVTEDPRLNSFFDASDRGPAEEASRRAVLDAPRNGPVAVLVTHQVNVTAVTGVFPASGEIVVVRPTDAGLTVLGTIKP